MGEVEVEVGEGEEMVTPPLTPTRPATPPALVMRGPAPAPHLPLTPEQSPVRGAEGGVVTPDPARPGPASSAVRRISFSEEE